MRGRNTDSGFIFKSRTGLKNDTSDFKNEVFFYYRAEMNKNP